jgi:hypothetical protein
MNAANTIDKVLALLDSNEALVARFYRIAAALFVGMMLAHAIFITRLQATHYTDRFQVMAFVTYNLTLLAIELLLGRITFMLAGRSGQLRDMKLIFTAMGSSLDTDAFERLSRGVMILRRDRASSMKLIDIEKLASTLKAK